ncbi:hypothetical protein QFC21_001991 [Naganishia friedmannii]|uniref:Uncharacterized protein n=1 Tax=Naganishia friedmannii TaxID=89922 RepID=A0ACC2VZI4_9TREE|nr:hypothetical protein QFC21_001991 [Naganishia friedmannii]
MPVSTPVSASTPATASKNTSTAVAGGAGSEQNAIARPNSPVYNPLYAGLLGLLALLILAVLYYLWKLNRRKAAASFDNNQEKRPLKAISVPARYSYAPSDFFSGMLGNREGHQMGRGYAQREDGSSKIQHVRKGSVWDKVSEVGRNSILPVLGYARKPNNLSRLQVNDQDSNSDVDRATPLPAPIVSAQRSPVKRNAISRLFSKAKEPKSPRPARFLAKTFVTSSTVDNDYSLGAYSALGPAQPGEAVAYYNRKEGSDSQSANKPRAPLPPPLRKRNLKKAIVGTPQARGVIVPGEMAGTAVPLISMEEARARAAASRSGLPLPERQLSTVAESLPYEPSFKMAPSPKSPMVINQNVHRSLQSSQPRSIRDISRPVSVIRPASSSLRNEIGRGAEERGEGAPGNNFRRWTPTPPRLATPRVKELRRDLLSGRSVIETQYSNQADKRGLHTPELPSTVLSRPTLRKRSVTGPCDLGQYKAHKVEINLSPFTLPDFSDSPQYPLLQQHSRMDNKDEYKFEPDISPTATKPPGTANISRRGSGFDWQAGAINDPRISLPSSYSTHGTGERECSEEDYDSDEEQEGIAELQGASLRYQSFAQSSTQEERRTSSVWSQPSVPADVDEGSREHASYNDDLLLEPVQPLNLTPDRPYRRLPTAPRRPSMMGGETGRQTSGGDKQYSTQGILLAPPVGKQSRQRMGSLSPNLGGEAFGSPREISKIPAVVDADANDPSLSPTATRENVTGETAEVPAIAQKPSTRRKPISPELLKEIENVEGRFAGQTPMPMPSVLLGEGQRRPSARFSDEVSVLDDGQFAFSPPPRTIRLVTPPPLLVHPESHRSSPVILAPQPMLRRGSMMPPDRMATLASQPAVREGSIMLPQNMENLTPRPSARRGSMMPPGRITATSPSPFVEDQPENLPQSTKATAPSADAHDPKAVQTRGEWRHLRKTSVTGYYLGVTQDDSESSEIHSGEEGESILR